MADASYLEKLKAAEQFRVSSPEKFEQRLNELSQIETEFNPSERCFYQFLRYYQEGYLGDYQDTINKIQSLGETCDDLENQLRIKKFLANMQMITGNFKEAITNLNEAIELSDEVNDNDLKSQVLNVAAISYRLMNQDSLSIQYADLLINLRLNDDDVCLGQFNKYRVLMRQGRAKQHETEIMQSIDNCYAVDNAIAALFLKFDWYRYTTGNGVTDPNLAAQAAAELADLKEQVEQTGFKNIQVYYQALMAKMMLQAGDISAANSNALLAIENNHSIGESEQLLMALEVLVDIYVNGNNFEQGYRFLKQKTQVENAIYQRKLATQVAYYSVLHENLAQELEIDQLNQNNELLILENQLAAETTKRQRLMMLLIASVLLLLGIWTYKIKKRHDYFKEVAEIDHLTQVFTRKAFEEKVREMLDRYKEQQKPVNLAIMDLDHFKNVNDQFGHLVGDWVLKQVILTCEEVADQDILMARLGGEEFCIVSPEITQLEMMRLMEKMRGAIEEMDCSESGAVFEITASFGVTNTSVSGHRVSMLLTHADLALFEAKNKGRNEVVAFDEIMHELTKVGNG